MRSHDSFRPVATREVTGEFKQSSMVRRERERSLVRSLVLREKLTKSLRRKAGVRASGLYFMEFLASWLRTDISQATLAAD